MTRLNEAREKRSGSGVPRGIEPAFDDLSREI